MKPKFDRWAQNLAAGCAVRGAGARTLEHISVQEKGGYQNAYVFAEHEDPTGPLWAGIRARRMPALCGPCVAAPG